MLCNFHLQQACRRWLDTAMKSKSKDHLKVKQRLLFKTKTMVYSPFMRNPLLIPMVYDLLRKQVVGIKNIETSKDIKKIIEEYITFLKKNYFNPQSFKGYHHWDYFSCILDGEGDCTNNGSECLNRKFNHQIKLGFKSFSKVCDSIHENKSSYLDEWGERVKTGRLHTRRPELRRKMEARKAIITEFNAKTNIEQRATYTEFLSSIQKHL